MSPIETLTRVKTISKDGHEFSVYTGNFDTFLKAEYPTLESGNEYYVESDDDGTSIILVCDSKQNYAYMISENETECIDILVNDLLEYQDKLVIIEDL